MNERHVGGDIIFLAEMLRTAVVVGGSAIAVV